MGRFRNSIRRRSRMNLKNQGVKNRSGNRNRMNRVYRDFRVDGYSMLANAIRPYMYPIVPFTDTVSVPVFSVPLQTRIPTLLELAMVRIN